MINDQTFENYGGRVTEILVRPLLCAFMPQLAAIYQPLSGEYAFRRKPVETISFSSGYGVEIGLIFDISRTFGLSRFVQVDMGTRCHRNRPVGDLSRMALGIIQTLFKKLEKENVLSLKTPIGTTMITRGTHGMEHCTISEVDSPQQRIDIPASTIRPCKKSFYVWSATTEEHHRVLFNRHCCILQERRPL